MKVPKAYLKTSGKYRARLYVPEKRDSSAYFAMAKARIEAIDKVRRVEVNPITGSILIHFAGELQGIIEAACKIGLFVVQGELGAYGFWVPDVFRAVDDLDKKIRRSSDGAFDLANSVALIFAGLGAVQLARGNILPAASALFLYAAQFFTFSKNELFRTQSTTQTPRIKGEPTIK